jgi:hypothetical protein
MTPPPNHSHPCERCFLQEQRGGRVCPVAHEVHRLPDVEAERHAAALHAAILADAEVVVGFAELVRRDAVSHHTGALPASIRLGLLVAPSADTPSPVTKELAYVIPTRTK